jgi:hypothetical protein
MGKKNVDKRFARLTRVSNQRLFQRLVQHKNLPFLIIKALYEEIRRTI